MKNLLFLLFIASSLSCIGQSSTDIVGVWQNEDVNQHIEIYQKNDNLFYAKIVWLKNNRSPHNQSLYDIENKDPEKSTRPLTGIDILLEFEYLEDKHLWKSGKIYNFKNGNSYNGKIQLKEEGLHLTGFYGILFFLGKTQKWTKVTN